MRGIDHTGKSLTQLSRVTDPNSSPTGVSLRPSMGSQPSMYVDLWQKRASEHACSRMLWNTLMWRRQPGGGSLAPGGRSADAEKYVSTLASRRCWPTATSCSSRRRNILTEHVGLYQKNLYRRTFLRRTATTRYFIQASYSSRPPTQIRATVGLSTPSYARPSSR